MLRAGPRWLPSGGDVLTSVRVLDDGLTAEGPELVAALGRGSARVGCSARVWRGAAEPRIEEAALHVDPMGQEHGA